MLVQVCLYLYIFNLFYSTFTFTFVQIIKEPEGLGRSQRPKFSQNEERQGDPKTLQIISIPKNFLLEII